MFNCPFVAIEETYGECRPHSFYAVLVAGANGDGARRGQVTIVELIDPRPYIFQPAVYGKLICTVICTSDRLLSQAIPDPHLPPSPELRSYCTRPLIVDPKSGRVSAPACEAVQYWSMPRWLVRRALNAGPYLPSLPFCLS